MPSTSSSRSSASRAPPSRALPPDTVRMGSTTWIGSSAVRWRGSVGGHRSDRMVVGARLDVSRAGAPRGSPRPGAARSAYVRMTVSQQLDGRARGSQGRCLGGIGLVEHEGVDEARVVLAVVLHHAGRRRPSRRATRSIRSAGPRRALPPTTGLTATTGARRRAAAPRACPAAARMVPDRDERVRGRDDDRAPPRRWRPSTSGVGRASSMPRRRISSTRRPAGRGARSSPGTRASRRACGSRCAPRRRSWAAGAPARPSRARQLGGDLGQARPSRSSWRAAHVRGHVPVAQPEPGLGAVASAASPRSTRSRRARPSRSRRWPGRPACT